MKKKTMKKYKPRVPFAKGGVNTRRAEPDDRSIGKKVTKPVNKPTEPTITRGAGGGPNFNKPPTGSTGSSVLPGQPINKGPKPIREQPISIGGVGGNDNATPEPTPIGTTTPETPAAPVLKPASEEAMRTTQRKDADLDFDAARQERIRETGLQIEASATGDVPDAVKIPAAMKVGVDAEGKPLKGQQQKVTEMADPTKVDATTAQDITEETVSTVDQVKEGVVDKQVTAATFDAITKEQPAVVQAAIMDLTPEVKDRITAEVQDAAMSDPTKAAEIAQQAIQDSLAPEVKGELRPISQVQPIAPKEAVEVAPITDADASTRQAQIISEKQKTDILQNVTGEGVDLEQIPQYEIAKQRTAQVAEATTKIAQELGTAPSMDAAMREAITSDGVAKGDAAQIGGVPTFEAASRQAVTKEARKAAAADMLAVVGEMPEEVTAAILEDPATVEAQLDTQPVNVQAAVAALPKEALVSTQMEGLLGGLEEGKTPAWARPAVDAVNAMMAQRGLNTSTVGRDALFNAIIQSAMPIAQSNAQALQQRASQNLSNEQQANLQKASQVMQQRMTNLSNQQTAASQTAQMAQQIVVKQGEFDQQAVMTTAQQEQQVRMTNIQNEQQKAQQESAQRQQVAISNLDAGTKMDLANLTQLNAASRETMSAEQQGRLAEYQAKVNRDARQAMLNQEMEKANLDSSLKVELANLSEMNQAARESMSAEQQSRLTNLNVLVDFKKTDASMAQQMDMANMSAENQVELANLSERAAADSANFSEANKFRLQELTTTASFLSQNAEIRQKAEMAKMGAEEKITLANLTVKNQADSESMSANNQMELANLNKRLTVAQKNADLAQQLGLTELSFEQNSAMNNAQINANMDMANFNAEQQTALANSKFMQTATLSNFNADQQAIMQDATTLASMNLANLDSRTKLAAQNAQAFLQVDMANLSNNQQANVLKAQQDQQRLLSNQSFENAAAQFGAASENQTNQFMANLNAQMSQYNASQTNAMGQFNATQENAAEARRAGRDADKEKFNAQLTTQVDQFNSQQDFARNSWNAQNAAAVESSNIQWRRQSNTINVAAQNQINMQNSQNAYGMTMQSQAFLWQELRDQADFDFRAFENEQNRQAQIISTAIANEGKSGQVYDDYLTGLVSSLSGSFSRGYSGSGSGGYGGGYGGGGSGGGSQIK